MAVVYENAKAGTAFVVESTLKVLTERDYLAINVITSSAATKQSQTGQPKREIAALPTSASNDANIKIIRDLVIPQLTKEVNEGANFAQLRQVYNSLILATWYKKKIKDGILSLTYQDKNKITGTEFKDNLPAQEIYARYIQAFKKGAYNYIKEEPDPPSGQLIARKYFSGGMNMAMAAFLKTGALAPDTLPDNAMLVDVRVDQVMVKVLDPNEENGQNFADAAMMNLAVRKAELIARRMHINMRVKDVESRRFFILDKNRTELKRKIQTNNGSTFSMFHHIQVSSSGRVQKTYEEVQEIVRRELGVSVNLINMDLKKIHVTIASDEVAEEASLTLSLDQLIEVVKKDIRGLSAFDIYLLGPYLMANGVVVMEYTTYAPEFHYLRMLVEKRKKRLLPPKQARVRIPTLMHSTVTVIRDDNISGEVLERLRLRLAKYRKRHKPILFRVNEITATKFKEEIRSFVASKSIKLRGRYVKREKIKKDPAMKGGIDLTPGRTGLEIKDSGALIRFHPDPAMIKQWQNSPGVSFFIISIQSISDIKSFLGIPAVTTPQPVP